MRLTWLDHAPLRLQGGGAVIDPHPDDDDPAPLAVGGRVSGHVLAPGRSPAR